MLKRLAILLLFLFVSAGYLAAERALYVVTTQTLNVRRGPGKQYYAYGEFHKGDHILVKGKTGDWAIVQDGQQTGYVSTRYIRYVRAVSDDEFTTNEKPKAQKSAWDTPYEITKAILWLLAIVVIITFFINETIAGVAMIIQMLCGIGALIGWLFFDNGRAGAVIAMGIEIIIPVIILVRHIGGSSDWDLPGFASLTRFIWAIVSLPFYILNLLQFWLSKPWRPFMKRNTLPDSSKPFMRTFLRILQIPFYLALFPLRFVNAVYYNIVLYNLYAWSNYIIEVLAPTDDTEGAAGFGEWIIYLPKRIGKYWLYHGLLTTIESIVWTIIDTFVPSVTLYHGTAETYADNMLCDPNRNAKRTHSKGWLTGVWNVGGGNYAGDGIYFGIFRKTLRNYEQGAAIVARVTMGKTIDTVLMPDSVYYTAGKPNAKAVSNWGLNNGYVCGEWWRRDRGTNWWEICLYDRQNRYNDSWRIRPIYVIHSDNGIMQRIPGGPAHWLFRKQVVADIKTSLSNLT